jgi:PucR C-terminal helix-turn-helix domain
MPFIEVTTMALGRLVNERYDVLRRSVIVPSGSSALCSRTGGVVEIVAAIFSAVGAGVLVLGAPGQVLALHDPVGELSATAVAAIGARIAGRGEARSFVVPDPRLTNDVLARPVVPARGQWERAARELCCHRHTLRHRMQKVEELTGRDLSQANDRIEFWLALRARELSR